MQLYRGRLFDHVHLRTRNLDAMKQFYRAVLDTLGVESNESDAHFNADELWIDIGGPATHIHLAFQAADREMVRRFYEAGLAAGGRDNGAPGERDYHRGYYAAFLWDPDGNNIEAVYHGPAERSAPSVEISF